MKKLLLFAGTTEGRKLSEQLSAAGIIHTVCVATEYGESILEENEYVKIHKGRMNQEEIKTFIWQNAFNVVVDATHPYAKIVTQNIQLALKDMDIPYIRLKRDNTIKSDYKKIYYYKDSMACMKDLEKIEGNILLTIGSKELATFCKVKEVKQRLYVRILPSLESLEHCINQGITGKQILALQGPFTTKMNEAILHQYQIKCLVTKESGRNSGYQEKLEAAEKLGIPVYVIGSSKEDNGYSFQEVCYQLESLYNKPILRKTPLNIILAGIGMGSPYNLTREVHKAIQEADILIGAERMIAEYQPKIEKKPFYKAEQIIPYLEEIQNKKEVTKKVVILFSGDSSFYSGCQSLYYALQQAIQADRLKATVSIMPGISSVSYLAACIGESYHDAAIYSLHGKDLPNLVRRISEEKKTFLILSGLVDMHQLGELLVKKNLKCQIIAGYQLSYPEQQIIELNPEDCLKLNQEGLYTCYIKNPFAKEKKLAPSQSDTVFIRDKVPMTKEEIREISICKLKLDENAVVYDIGSGTGSIAIEIASLSYTIKVFAIEKNKNAALLIEKNREKFELENIEIVLSNAPEGLQELPMPTHAFIGGSCGNLKAIVATLYQLNPKIRIVINAISIETICELKEILSNYPIQNEEMIQVQISRVKEIGRYHLMQAENPVWIVAFEFKEIGK